jgi:outer membrane immunogenic protein
MPVRRAPVYKAPPPVAAFSWSGCYIGAHGGYGWGKSRWTNDNPESERFGLQFASFDTDGALAGGQAGCDMQSGAWVGGIEVQGSWAEIKGDGIDPLTGDEDVHVAKADALWSITARLGYAFDRSLLYIKGGAAGAHFKYNSFDGDDGDLFARYANTRWGWTAGAGWEYAFDPNWSLKLEYMYMDFGSKDNVTPNLQVDGTLFRKNDEQIHTVKIGLNYRFGGYGVPVTARY